MFRRFLEVSDRGQLMVLMVRELTPAAAEDLVAFEYRIRSPAGQ